MSASNSDSHAADTGDDPLIRHVELEATSKQRKGRPSVNIVWIVVGAGIVSGVVALFAAWQRNDEQHDFGSVSHHWIAEHRFGQADDPRH
jgi:hypothetical protein